jgi:hypothetical protein
MSLKEVIHFQFKLGGGQQEEVGVQTEQQIETDSNTRQTLHPDYQHFVSALELLIVGLNSHSHQPLSDYSRIHLSHNLIVM